MATVTLPDGNVLTRIPRKDVLGRIGAIEPGVIPYSQGKISPITDKRSDCTGLTSYCWNTPDSGPGIYLKAYNTASFFTQRVLVRIGWNFLLPGDTIGYFSPTSPGNGGHAAIWMGGDKFPSGTFDVWDHGSGMGPKRRRVKWDGQSTGWLHPNHLAPWRYVGIIEDDGTTYEPGQLVDGDDNMYCKYGDNSNNVETLQWTLFRVFKQNLGTSGPNKNGVDRQYGNRVGAALATVLGRSDGTAVIDGVSTPILKVYGPDEVSDLADKVAQKRAAEVVVAAPPNGGVTVEQVTEIATEVATELIANTTVVLTPPQE